MNSRDFGNIDDRLRHVELMMADLKDTKEKLVARKIQDTSLQDSASKIYGSLITRLTSNHP